MITKYLSRVYKYKTHPLQRCIGLHIPKCAGTSLMSYIRRHLDDDQYYIFSSFYANLKASRLEFYDITDRDRLLFVFGHSMNQYMYKILNNMPSFLFTGLREPRNAVTSDFFYYIKTKRRSSSYVPDVKEFLDSRSNFVCKSLINRFPAVAEHSGEKSLAKQAFAVLSLFDHIYDSDTIGKTSRPILRQLGLNKPMNIRANVKSKSIDNDSLAQQAHTDLKFIIDDYFSDDIELYSLYTTNRTIDNFGACRIQPSNKYLSKIELMETLPDIEKCEEMNRELLFNEIVFETNLLNSASEVKSILRKRIKNSEKLIQSINEKNN